MFQKRNAFILQMMAIDEIPIGKSSVVACEVFVLPLVANSKVSIVITLITYFSEDCIQICSRGA